MYICEFWQSKTWKSYIRDTSVFLLKLKLLSTVPSASILVTVDVNDISINIDHMEGADVCNIF